MLKTGKKYETWPVPYEVLKNTDLQTPPIYTQEMEKKNFNSTEIPE